MGAFLRKYGSGAGSDVAIPMVKAGLSDFAINTDWIPAAGDVKISKDGGAQSNIASLPTYSNGDWIFTFSDAELQARRISVRIVDTAPKAVEDSGFNIETFGKGIVWVSPTGSDTAPGGPEAPVLTIARAIAIVGTNGEIHVRAGTYNIGDAVLSLPDGVNAIARGKVIIQSSAALTDKGCVLSGGSDYSWEGFTVELTGDASAITQAAFGVNSAASTPQTGPAANHSANYIGCDVVGVADSNVTYWNPANACSFFFDGKDKSLRSHSEVFTLDPKAGFVTVKNVDVRAVGAWINAGLATRMGFAIRSSSGGRTVLDNVKIEGVDAFGISCWDATIGQLVFVRNSSIRTSGLGNSDIGQPSPLDTIIVENCQYGVALPAAVIVVPTSQIRATDLTGAALAKSTGAPTTAQIQAALIKTPNRKLDVDANGMVGVNNLPAVPTAEENATAAATAILQVPANKLLTNESGQVETSNTPNIEFPAVPTAAENATAAAAAILVAPENKIRTNAGGQVEASNVQVSSPIGPGADKCTIEITDDQGRPVADADVWITQDAAGTNVVAGTLQTDTEGRVVLMLSDGLGYYLWMQKDGVNPIVGQPFTAEKDG